MNDDQIAGTWSELVGRAKLAWAELTDDDVLRAEGSVEKLTGIIQAKWGDAREAIAERLKSAASKPNKS